MKIPVNLSRLHLEKAANKIIHEGIPSNALSSTYDVLYKGELLPPKLIVSYANIFANGKELDRNSFEGGIGTESFNLLDKEGFKIIKKNGYYPELSKFFDQAATSSQKTIHYKKEYLDLGVQVSFGQGNPAKVPWISFLGQNQKTSDGIYPVYLYYKKQQILILAYGISETNKPALNWKLNKGVLTIRDFFIKNNLGIPDRYGASYVYKVYYLKSMPTPLQLDNDLLDIITEYKSLLKGDDSEISQPIFEIRRPQVNHDRFFEIQKFINNINYSGLFFSKKMIIRFVSSLLTKPFVILTGLSGSGKTKLAQAFTKWICTDENQYCVVPVGADWTNREPLLGYPNALKPDEYVKPDNGVLDLIIRANKNRSLPYFLILDEMNLSHVESYFADFLSVMESNEEIPLFAEGAVNNGVPAKLNLPDNLFIIGTVNIDETTYMFSPKVLDRANTIEFRVNEDEIEYFLNNKKNLNLGELKGRGSSMAKSFIEMSRNKTFDETDKKEINETLVAFFKQLKKAGAEFGYRSANEIIRLINQLNAVDSSLSVDEKLDISIMQKLLPKLHGSRRKLCPVLITLGGFCVTDKISNIEKEIFEKEDFDFKEMEKVKYPLSLEKITRMHKGAIDNGFASYAEA